MLTIPTSLRDGLSIAFNAVVGDISLLPNNGAFL